MKIRITTLWLVSVLALLVTALPLKADEPNKKNADFVHGIMLKVDGKYYYLAGAPDGPNGATDIPGHSWVVAGKDKIIGKHLTPGPLALPSGGLRMQQMVRCFIR